MIPRYTLPVIGQIWEDKVKYDTWLAIEVAACEAMNKLGLVPDDDIKIIKEKASYDIDRVAEIEEETKHDVIAFLTAVAEKVGPSSRYIHMGMTSSDILDTTLSVQMVKSCDLILEKLDELIVAIKKKAIKYKKTPQMGRSHGIHAEPVTFGLKMALMYEEFVRNKKRLESAREDVCVGQVSGAVGTKAHIDPSVEEYVCEKLGLKPANISTQIIQRDRHAMFLSVFAVVASSLDKYALEIRNLQKTEVLEVEEFFAKGQKGSSAMPHKRNPITCERVCGLARLIRGNALAGLENVALWHERDITHSSVERIIIPDSCIILYYMLTLMTNVIENLIVYPEHMM
ncbi:MAG: adenylosuccinate lyase, partial [Candidatus Aureabacteria bacterium]|nr:adenylosuccinate lyase [Candidatus Auribacterota bacterium]